MENVRWSLKLVEKLKGLFGNRRAIIVLLAMVAVGVLLLCIPSGSSEGVSTSSDEELTEYKAQLESELAEICASVSGVGKCRVMITFERGAEKVYKGSQLVESSPPRVSGVTVVCEGGESQTVKGTLTEMISALFGIGKNRIAVLESKN